MKLTDLQPTQAFRETVRRIVSKNGWDLESLSQDQPVLTVFLRHLGCVYCWESLLELERVRPEIESQNMKIAIIHMGTDQQAADLLEHYGLDDLERFSDPDRELYAAFGLERTTLGKMLGLRQMLDWIRTGTRTGFSVRGVVGDIRQMPGVFVVDQGCIVSDFRPERLSEKPEYLELAALECAPG